MKVHDELEEVDDDPLIVALARTPGVKPFKGTERYRVCACIGEGGFGVVYEVEDLELGRRLALKTLKPQRAGFAANIHRLKREFRSVADLVHPNLVGLHELSSDGTRWFFTMDLVRGQDVIAHVIADPTRLRDAFYQLAAGVAALHEAGIVHRDLKPPNVLVESDGRLVILDFGLADSRPDDPELLDAGTPVYLAPEGAIGPASDWYAVGVMLHEALTGRLPSDRVDPPSRSADGSEDLHRLCRALLRPDPRDRPTAAIVLDQLGSGLAPAVDARRPRASHVFVGRAAELAALRAAGAAHQPAVIRVHGQPGVGKSALVDQFTHELRERGTVTLAGRCYERESVPFKAFDGVVDALVRHLQTLPRSEATGLMPRDVHLIAQLFPVFEAIAALGDVPRRRLPVGDSHAVRVRAFAAIKELIARLADKQPLVIVIDDLQWGDLDSARLLASLVAPPDRPSLLLVLCYRSDDGEQDPTLAETLRALDAVDTHRVELAVDPLPARDAEELAALLLGDGDGSRDAAVAARTIAQRGEGHPLFMAELARVHLSATAAGPPPTLIDILWERMVRLSASARALLEIVSVAGGPVASSLCYDAAGLGSDGVDAMRVLRAEQLVRAADQGGLNVFHDRIRDAVLMRTDSRTRCRRHLALARCLEREPEPDLEALARHFDAASEHELAAGYAVRAGDAAIGSLAFDRAAALYRLAIDRGGDSAALYEKLGDALDKAGSTGQAGMAYLEAAARATGRHAIELRRRIAQNLCTAGDFDAGYRALEQVLGEVGETMPPTVRRATIEGIYHTVRLRLSRFRFHEQDEASIPADRLLHLDVLDSASYGLAYISMARAFGVMMRYTRMALRTGEPHRAARGLVLSTFGLVGMHPAARPAKIDTVLDRVDAIAERIGDPQLSAMSLRARGESYFYYGNLVEARKSFEAGAALISERCLGMGAEQRFMQMLVARIDFLTGDLDRTRQLADILLVDAVQREDPVAERAVCVNVLAPLRLADDDPDDARRCLARATLEDRCGVLVFRAESHASIASYLGRSREAVEAWRSRWPTIEREQMLIAPAFRVMAVRSLALALITSAEHRGHVREAAALAKTIRGWRNPVAAAVWATVQAYLALDADHVERAAERLDEAARLYATAGMPLDAAACRHRRGRLIGGDTGAVETAAAEAALRERRIARPERWVAMALPELERRRLSA